MRDNGHNVYSADLQDVVNEYDHDNDGFLNLHEFQCMLLTATDSQLRKRCRERFEEQLNFTDRLSLEIENQMASIILFELSGLKEVYLEREVLKQRYDFTRLDAFRAIDYYQMNSIFRDDLRMFLNKHGHYASASDADHLMRRLDRDQDGRLNNTEFIQYIDSIHLINSTAPSRTYEQAPTKQMTPKARSRNTGFDSTNEQNFSQTFQKPIQVESNTFLYNVREDRATPLKKIASSNNKVQKSNQSSNSKLASLNTTPSPTKQINKSVECSPVKEKKQLQPRKLNLETVNEVSNEGISKMASLDASNQNQQVYLPPLDLQEEMTLAETLKNMIMLENDIEKSKQHVALQADYNLLDAFKIFDQHNLGEVYRQDLENGLMQLGIFGLRVEVELMFKRFDINGDHRIRYLEFVDALTPKDKLYANHLLNKKPNYQAQTVEDAMSEETRVYLADALRCIMKCEFYTEELRQRLATRPYFSISAAFSTLDIQNKGHINSEEIKIFLEDHEFFATQKELQLLFEKMDKDKDGKITYSEFFLEFAAKQMNSQE